ncbi:MAG: hypothetical protein E7644_00825 [Ruminococcaceae bacterium]|nr:hypothetical protein [Oscillospiraceae bacterium]
MKRTLSLLLAMLLCALLFVGCKPAVKVDLIGGVSLRGFADFLDAEHMVPEIASYQFCERMGAYEYPEELKAKHGGTIEVSCGCYDNFPGGGSYVTSIYFSYSTGSSELRDGKWRHIKSFEAQVEMIGMSMPFGITFQDTMTDAFKKIGIGEGHCAAIISNFEGTAEETTLLYQQDGISLSLSRELNYDWEGIEEGDNAKSVFHRLDYAESQSAKRSDGQPMEVVRTVSLWFREGQPLYKIKALVLEEH